MKLLVIVTLAAFISVLQVNSSGNDTVEEEFIICALYNEKHPLGIAPFTSEDLMSGESIIALVHSWLEDSHEPWILTSIDNIFHKYKTVNVVTVDYGKYSKNSLYLDVYNRIPAIAQVAAKQCHDRGIETNLVTVIAYSLGAQLAGAVAKLINAESKPMFKSIIALDAAGTFYDPSKPSSTTNQPYLQSGDAEQVVGLYSDRNGAGMHTQYADKNIFINDGSNLDCEFDCSDEDISSQSCEFCASIYARETFVKAIPKDPEYVARKCDKYENYDSCSANEEFVLEIFFNIDAENGLYFIKINEDFEQIP